MAYNGEMATVGKVADGNQPKEEMLSTMRQRLNVAISPLYAIEYSDHIFFAHCEVGFTIMFDSLPRIFPE